MVQELNNLSRRVVQESILAAVHISTAAIEVVAESITRPKTGGAGEYFGCCAHQHSSQKKLLPNQLHTPNQLQ